MQAALRNTQIPNWVLTKDEDGQAIDFELSDDPYDVSIVSSALLNLRFRLPCLFVPLFHCSTLSHSLSL